MAKQKIAKTDVKLLSVKQYGRSHLACMKCRTQKIKCSGTLPTCRNCLIGKHECVYPKRDRKITLLESQLEKLNNKIKYLEDRLTVLDPDSKLTYDDVLESPSDLVNEADIRDNSMENTNEIQTVNTAEQNKMDEKGNSTNNINDEIISLNSNSNITTDSKYFGTSSAQVFDSALKLHLCEIGSSSDMNLKPRYFFRDPTLSTAFPGAILLPDKLYALSLVRKVISFIGHEYYLFDTSKFFKDIDEVYANPSKKNSLWICYFLITLAVGEQYLNYSMNGEIPGIRFYTSAMNLYKPSYEEPTLEFVQMLLLIAFYLQGLNSANAAFTFYGLASRAALIQGLHRKMDSGDPVEQEKRKRVWWSVFVMESIWCSNLGHPIHVQVSDIDIELPCDNPHDLNDDFNCPVLEYNAKLAMIMGSVMSHVYIPSKGATSVKFTKMLGCLEELEQFQKKLPEIIKNDLLLSNNRSSANLYLRLNHDIIVTTRPLLLSLFKGHVQPSEVVKSVVLRCLNAAILNIDILEHLKSTNWLSTFGFWDAQFCFTALMILIICSWSGNSYPQTEIGKSLHIYMREAGNFTAADNDNRLSDLNELLSKIPKYKQLFGSSIIKNKNRRYEANNSSNQIPTTQGISVNLPANNEEVHTKDDFFYPESILQVGKTDMVLPENVVRLDNSIFKNDGESDHKNENTEVTDTEPIAMLNQTLKLSDIVLKSPNSDFEQIGDFAVFRNNFSPDTWNELTGNDFLWDPFSTSQN